MPQWLLWSCLPGNPGNWQLPPESQLYNVTMQGSQNSLSTSPVPFCWGELLFPWRLQGEEKSCLLKERLPHCLALR